MKKPMYLLWIAGTEAVGFLSGFLSRDGTAFYNRAVTKPSFSPPSAVFPIAWGLLYALMGIGAARIAAGEESVARGRALKAFAIQLGVNFFWSLIFFNVRAYGFALLWLLLLWALVMSMILLFAPVDRLAARLQVPYLLWLTFAACLNAGVWLLNG